MTSVKERKNILYCNSITPMYGNRDVILLTKSPYPHSVTISEVSIQLNHCWSHDRQALIDICKTLARYVPGSRCKKPTIGR